MPCSTLHLKGVQIEAGEIVLPDVTFNGARRKKHNLSAGPSRQHGYYYLAEVSVRLGRYQ